jgi:hypothetical protein
MGQFGFSSVNPRFGTKNQNATNRHKKIFGQKQKIRVK